ncbi:MAG: hypothetical protein ACI965_000675 [Paraglaciecola sp.]|jgi:hypothetical protein
MSKHSKKQSDAMYGISRIHDEKHRTMPGESVCVVRGRCILRTSLIKSMLASAKRCDWSNSSVMSYYSTNLQQHVSNFVQ